MGRCIDSFSFSFALAYFASFALAFLASFASFASFAIDGIESLSVRRVCLGNGGKAIFLVDEAGTNLSALFEVFNQTWPEPHMVQPFLPEVAEGDKRIVLVDGEFAGAINRKPGEGEFRSNLAQGGYAEAAGLTAREEEICAAMGPELKRRGLVFVGIDVIGGRWLTEINVTSPTGIVAIDRFNGTDTAGLIWDAIEKRAAA